MNIYALIYPGTWLNLPGDSAHELKIALHLLVEQFADANIALIEFDKVYNATAVSKEARQKARTARIQRSSEIGRLLREEYPNADDNDIRVETDRRIIEEQLGTGRLPESFSSRLPFIHARSFLHAMEGIRKRLVALAAHSHAPAAIRGELERFEGAFPGLKDVRDSEQHRDERERRLSHKKPIVPQPIDDSAIRSTADVMVVGNLHGRSYQMTAADGALHGLEVSCASMGIAQAVIQSVLDAFSWHGPKQFVPQ